MTGLWLGLLGGCLYVAPPWSPRPNPAPEILRPEGPDLVDIPLVVDRDTRITVVATDPPTEDEVGQVGRRIEFVWIVPVDVAFVVSPPARQGDLWYSVLTLPRDPVLDGQTIELVVSDLQEERFLSWLVEVPQ